MQAATLERPVLARPALAHAEGQRRRKAASDEDRGQAALNERQSPSLRARESAALFLHRQGYDILERDWACEAGCADIICRHGENGTLVFAAVQSKRGGFPSERAPLSREQWEGIALAYLAKSELRDAVIRFDAVDIVPMERGRMFVRHHVGALS